MELVHRFSVPLPVDEAWARFNDIAATAECFPGAVVSSADDEGFTGSVKVRLGPIALLYNGTGTFVERDASARTMRIEAKGKDKRGNGTAAANVLLSMTGTEQGTDVEVTTDLSVTGKPAQFGRGVMQDVSDKLLGQFVACLEERYAEGSAATAETGAGQTPTSPPVGDGSPGPTEPHGTPPPASPPRAAAPSAPAGDGAIDLGTTVLPVLARTYGPWLAAAVGVVLALRSLRGRRR